MRNEKHAAVPKAARRQHQRKASAATRVEEKRVAVDDRTTPAELDPFAVFAEWASAEDERLYRGL